MTPTITFDEAMATYRKYGIMMSQQKLTEMLKRDLLPFAEAIELSTWSYTIWRLPFYRYLAERGVPVVELRDHLEDLEAEGWDPDWEAS